MEVNLYEDIGRNKLNLKEEIVVNGREWMRKIHELKVQRDEETISSVWISIALFLSTSCCTKQRKITKLAPLIRATGIHVNEFIIHLLRACDKLCLPKVMKDANTLKKEFAESTFLFSKYNQLWTETINAFSLPIQEEMDEFFQMGWLLFLIVCHDDYDSSSRPQVLGDMYIWLLCIMNSALTTLLCEKEQHLRFTASSEEAEVAAALNALSSKAPRASQITEILCSNPIVPKDQVLRSISKINAMIVRRLQQFIPTNAQHTVASISSMFTQSSIAGMLPLISKYYEDTFITSVVSMDQRLFLDVDMKFCLTSKSSSPSLGSPVEFMSNKRKHVATDTPPRDLWPSTIQAWEWQGQDPPDSFVMQDFPESSSLPMEEPLISSAIRIGHWVNSVAQKDPMHHLSKYLTNIFSSCKVNPLPMIETLIESILSKMKNGDENEQQHLDTLNSFDLGVSIYFRVLESMVREESRSSCESQKQHGHFSCLLLHSSVFHRSLLACSLEVAFKTCGLLTLCFPNITKLCEICPLEFSKIISAFLKNMIPLLPRSLSHHLYHLEENVILWHAWEEKSSLFTLLQSVDASDNQRQNEESSTSSISTKLSEQNTASSRSLILFFRKVLAYSASRILHLGKKLNLQGQHLNQIWTVMKECILKYACELLFFHHLDTILLCSVYGVCKKSSSIDLSFGRLIEKHRETFPHSSSCQQRRYYHMIDHVQIRQGEYGDIISFYNSVFVPNLKSFLLQFQENSLLISHIKKGSDQIHTATQAATLAVRSYALGRKQNEMVLTLPDIEAIPRPQMSPTRIAKTNVFISPRPCEFIASPSITHTRVVYAFGESPSRSLQLINRAVNNNADKKVQN